MDILNRINELRNERGWSVNTLADEAGIEQTTLRSALYRNNAPPTIYILEGICQAFNITLSQFFYEGESTELLSAQEKKVLESYRRLCPESRNGLSAILRNLR